MELFCIRCGGQGERTRAVGIAGGNSLCGLHLHGYLFGGSTYRGQFTLPVTPEDKS